MTTKKQSRRIRELEADIVQAKEENERLKDEISDCVSVAIENDMITVHDIKRGFFLDLPLAKRDYDCKCRAEGCGCTGSHAVDDRPE